MKNKILTLLTLISTAAIAQTQSDLNHYPGVTSYARFYTMSI
jgi:hypothetical protein